LGLIGEVQEDKTLEITLNVRKEDFSDQNFDDLDVPLVEGRNLSNCEECRSRVELPENQRDYFEEYCRIEVDEAPAEARKWRKDAAPIDRSTLGLRKRIPPMTATPKGQHRGEDCDWNRGRCCLGDEERWWRRKWQFVSVLGRWAWRESMRTCKGSYLSLSVQIFLSVPLWSL
jgi:hypothetical protein